jgi:hypothetical protein
METALDTWRFAVEIQSDFKGLGVIQSDIQAYFERCGDAHDIEVERPATLVVRMSDQAAAERFQSTFGGTLTRF